ncbi:hypothetical protein GCM10010483_26750 [Actinokineospora diospyrosa]
MGAGTTRPHDSEPPTPGGPPRHDTPPFRRPSPCAPAPHHTTGGVPGASLSGVAGGKGGGGFLWTGMGVVDKCDLGKPGALGGDSPGWGGRRWEQAPGEGASVGDEDRVSSLN